jgi:hypothetical protein
MTRSTPETRLGVARDADGTLYIPAQQVTSLLRGLVGQFQDWGHDDEQPVLDQATLHLVTGALLDAADQIDVECISRTPTHPQTGPGQEGEQP